MKSIFDVFNNKWFKYLLLVIMVQQLLVAGGTYFLGLLTSEFPTNGFQVEIAAILFLCILLPGTIVHYGVSWFLARASKEAQFSYLNTYIVTNFNHPMHWRDENSKQQRHDIMCKGGQETIQTAVLFFADLTATSLNIFLNTISIMLVTDVILGVCIFVAGLAGLLIIHLSAEGISESSRNEILADNRLNAHLSRSWDNVILGNKYFYNRWMSYFNLYFLNTEKATLKTVQKKDWSISMAGLVTNGLVLGCALTLAWSHQASTGFVLAILVMLPRSLQIVMHMQIIQTYFAKWKNLRQKLLVTQDSYSKPQTKDLSSFINLDKIFVAENEKNISIQNIEKILEKASSGRFTLTGQNGTGKSSLLLSLKDKYGMSAVYLPAQHQLTLCEAQLGLSSGEVALTALKDLQTEKCDILLLDEWDANLSSENRTIFNEVLDKLSLERIIVEVRH